MSRALRALILAVVIASTFMVGASTASADTSGREKITVNASPLPVHRFDITWN